MSRVFFITIGTILAPSAALDILGNVAIILIMNNLLQKTLALLQADSRSLRQISRESGISYQWVQKVVVGEIPNPGVKGVQKLFDFLTNGAR